MELLDYQTRVLSFLERPRNRHAFVVHGTGCGKTTMACYIAKEFIEKNIVSSVLFVAPVSIHGQIEENLVKLDVSFAFIKLLSYHDFLYDIDARGKLLIVDEVHNLRTTRGKMAKKCIKCCNEATKVLLMTASPFVNYETDLMNIIKMCLNKVSSRQPIADCLKEVNIFYKERPVSEDYPTFDIKSVDIELTEDEQNDYEKCMNNSIEEFDEDFHQRIGKLGSIFMIHTNSMRRVGDSGVLPKLRFIENTIENYGQQIVFSSWKKAGINQIENILEKKQIAYGVITGETSKLKRTMLVNDYNSKRIQVLLFSKAGGEGIDLKGTQRVIIVEPGWNSVVEQQAMNRAIRYKSHTHLPENLRHVIVEKLYINTRASRDLLLLESYIQRKEKNAQKIMKLLEQLSL
jgi:DNA or RNA helicases of superfamily II